MMIDINTIAQILTAINLILAFSIMAYLWLLASKMQGKSMANTIRILALAFIPFVASLVTEFIMVSYPWWTLLNLFSNTVFLLAISYALYLLKSSLEAYSHLVQKRGKV